MAHSRDLVRISQKPWSAAACRKMRSEKRRFFAPNKWFNDTSPNYVHGRGQSARGTVNSIFNRFVSNYTPTHVVSVKTQAIMLIDHPWLQRIIISKYCFRTLLETLWSVSTTVGMKMAYCTHLHIPLSYVAIGGVLVSCLAQRTLGIPTAPHIPESPTSSC